MHQIIIKTTLHVKGEIKKLLFWLPTEDLGGFDCDDHIVELAPHIPTLDEWKNSKMTSDDWKKFSKRYTEEMKSAKSQKAIRNLWERSNDGEMIRLLCYEKDDNPYCHRYMLKLFIDEYPQSNG